MTTKRIRLITLLAACILMISCGKSEGDNNNTTVSAVPPEGKGSVTWHNFNEGIQIARQHNKPVVIDFYADWCGYCKIMEREVFSDAAVARKLRDNYITVRVYMDKNFSERINFKNHVLTKNEFARMVGAYGLPTVVFMDREGEFITRIPGYIKRDVFLGLLSYILEECYLQNVPLRDYMSGKTPCNNKKK